MASVKTKSIAPVQQMSFKKKQKKSDSVFLIGTTPNLKKLYGDRGRLVELSTELDKEIYETQSKAHDKGKPYLFPDTSVEAFTEILKLVKHIYQSLYPFFKSNIHRHMKNKQISLIQIALISGDSHINGV